MVGMAKECSTLISNDDSILCLIQTEFTLFIRSAGVSTGWSITVGTMGVIVCSAGVSGIFGSALCSGSSFTFITSTSMDTVG